MTENVGRIWINSHGGKMDWRIRFSHWRKQTGGLGTKSRQRLRVEHRRQVGCGNVHEEGRALQIWWQVAPTIALFFLFSILIKKNCTKMPLFLSVQISLLFGIKALKIAP